MPRIRPRIVTKSDAAASRRAASPLLRGEDNPVLSEDAYTTKVIKYIPGEIVAAYQVGAGLIASVEGEHLIPILIKIWTVFLVVMAPIWTVCMTKKPEDRPAKFQAWASCAAMIVWVFALNGHFAKLCPAYQPIFGSLGLIVFTLVVPVGEKIFDRAEPETE